MKKVIIFSFIRDSRDHSRILGKNILRAINVHPSFVGNGDKGSINRAEFKKLADDLEPFNDGFTIC